MHSIKKYSVFSFFAVVILAGAMHSAPFEHVRSNTAIVVGEKSSRNNSSGFVRIIDNSSFDYPDSIALDKASGDLYISNGGGWITVMNGYTNSITGRINVSGQPGEIGFSSNGSVLYCIVYRGTSFNLSVFNVHSGTWGPNITVPQTARYFSVDSANGNIYMAGNGEVYVISPSTHRIEMKRSFNDNSGNRTSTGNRIIQDSTNGMMFLLTSSEITEFYPSNLSAVASLDVSNVSPGGDFVGGTVNPGANLLYVGGDSSGTHGILAAFNATDLREYWRVPDSDVPEIFGSSFHLGYSSQSNTLCWYDATGTVYVENASNGNVLKTYHIAGTPLSLLCDNQNDLTYIGKYTNYPYGGSIAVVYYNLSDSGSRNSGFASVIYHYSVPAMIAASLSAIFFGLFLSPRIRKRYR